MSNTLEKVLLVDYLKFREYEIDAGPQDPGKEDISYLLYVSKLIPKHPQDINNVDPKVLASLCLAAHSNASALLSQATLWLLLRKIDSEAALGFAINELGPPGVTAEKRSKNDPEYKNRAKLYAIGESYVKFYQNMLKNFEAGHYWAKSEEQNQKSQYKMAGYEPEDDIKLGGQVTTSLDSEVNSDFKF